MTLNVYVVRDRKTCFGTDMFIQPNDEVALRHFGNLMQELKRSGNSALIVNYPDDFDLYCIGTYDSETGVVTDIPNRFVCCAVDFMQSGMSVCE